ncbi:hypothetical protein [Protaetiibacter mangrovi]|uniref:Cytoplasmic protein n=1 Tax=Protaetiibacter mangrovi TaxID=2970926 RepID=A0ABT1ZBE5_9MICO|nr:hypothetical protein [Protaetiibacter mangrovi]MCS0498016.1 hypothetical protein [Protaetiibacter mangrovi]
MDRDTIEYDPNPDDERPVPLDEEEPAPPPTLDPEERVEEFDPDADDE